MEDEKKDAPASRGMNKRALAGIAAENIHLIAQGLFMPDGMPRRTQNRMLRLCKTVDILRVPNLQTLRDTFWERYGPADAAARPHCSVTNEESCSAARRLSDRYKPLVMNFADPYTPGGGFESGAPGQEESLCRQTTLYASLSHPEAYEIYQFNRLLDGPKDSGCMIWSPHVYIFRDRMLRRTEDIVEIAVLSLPAPKRSGPAREFPDEELDRILLRRIENFLMRAAAERCQALVLGAWGCGAFGNDPVKVSALFYKALYEERLAFFFKEIVFAVLDHSDDQRNYNAFASRFAEV